MCQALNEKLITVRAQLVKVKSQRQLERESFVKNQEDLAKRQYLFFQRLARLQQAKVSIPLIYMRVMQQLSKDDCQSPYVLGKEAKLCHALHQIEVTTKQLHVIEECHRDILQSLEKKLQEEIELSKSVRTRLLSFIKFMSTETTGSVIEQKSLPDWDHRSISCLKGEGPESKDDNASFGSLQKHSRSSNNFNMDEERVKLGSSFFGVLEIANAA